MFVLVPVCFFVYMYAYQCVVTCFPLSECNLIVNRWGSQTRRAYSSLSFIFLEIRNKEQFWILSLESITSTKNNHKPAKGSLSPTQLFATSPHLLCLLAMKEIPPLHLFSINKYVLMSQRFSNLHQSSLISRPNSIQEN